MASWGSIGRESHTRRPHHRRFFFNKVARCHDFAREQDIALRERGRYRLGNRAATRLQTPMLRPQTSAHTPRGTARPAYSPRTMISSSSSSSGAPTLDVYQSAVVSCPQQSLLVRSCAGSGKSTTLAVRAGALIAQGVPVDDIILLTFSVRSKVDLEQKLQRLLRECCSASTMISALDHRRGRSVFGLCH